MQYMPKGKLSDINPLKKHVNLKKVTGPVTIPPKLFKTSSNLIDSRFCNVILKTSLSQTVQKEHLHVLSTRRNHGIKWKITGLFQHSI